MAAANSGGGYLLASSTGRVYGFGGARPLPPNAAPVSGTVVGIAIPETPAGPGYWLLTRSGAVYSFGLAREIATAPPQPISSGVPTVPYVAVAAGR
jgi:hypothetical protein